MKTLFRTVNGLSYFLICSTLLLKPTHASRVQLHCITLSNKSEEKSIRNSPLTQSTQESQCCILRLSLSSPSTLQLRQHLPTPSKIPLQAKPPNTLDMVLELPKLVPSQCLDFLPSSHQLLTSLLILFCPMSPQLPSLVLIGLSSLIHQRNILTSFPFHPFLTSHVSLSVSLSLDSFLPFSDMARHSHQTHTS